jgi:hypothetical protein
MINEFAARNAAIAVPDGNLFCLLERVQGILQEEFLVKFPKNCCRPAMRALHDVAGLEMVAGVFAYTDASGVLREEDHFWNYDPGRRLYVDLTLHQFRQAANLPIPEIIAAPEDQLPWLQKKSADPAKFGPLRPHLAARLRKEFPGIKIPEYSYTAPPPALVAS